jgi:hypothetical protein
MGPDKIPTVLLTSCVTLGQPNPFSELLLLTWTKEAAHISHGRFGGVTKLINKGRKHEASLPSFLTHTHLYLFSTLTAESTKPLQEDTVWEGDISTRVNIH